MSLCLTFSGPSSVGDLWSTDATSGKAVPNSSAEWDAFITNNSLTIATPSYLHLCQESAGNLADSIGSLTLTAANIPNYQQTVPGWSRKGVGGNASGTEQFMNTSAPDPTTTSMAIFCYIGVTGDGVARDLFCIGQSSATSISCYHDGSKNILRYRQNDNIADTTQSGYTSTAFPALLLIDQTESRARLYTHLEKLSPTFGDPAALTRYCLGSTDATWCVSDIVYSCGWSGANAEMSDAEVKALFQALGYTISWS